MADDRVEGAGPVPQGQYAAATRHGDLVFTAGMTPRLHGKLICQGPLRHGQAPEAFREPARLSALNALAAAQGLLRPGESIGCILNLVVYMATDDEFGAHSAVADMVTACLAEQLGAAAIGSRSAVGVRTLPGQAPLEVALVAAIASPLPHKDSAGA